jgi:S-adenosyl-L-methionine hydrolase (adenosine-forming)
MPGYDWISLTTDYGLADGFVAACHGVIAVRAPGVRVIDVTHDIPPGEVSRAAAVLAQVAPYLPAAVHVAVVDPGVGTARRALAVQAGTGLLVGPDNGLLPPAAEALGGIRRAVALTNPDWFAATVSATFHGRDVFAPVAARLATGADLDQAGHPVDPATVVRLPDPVALVGDGQVDAEICLVDRYGNLQLAAPGSALSRLGHSLLVGGTRAVAGVTFADAPAGELVVYADSAGRLAVAVNGGRAAAVLSAGPGDVLRIANTPVIAGTARAIETTSATTGARATVADTGSGTGSEAPGGSGA